MVDRRGPFWDVLEGRVPPPPAALTLGWELMDVDPEAPTIDLHVQFLRAAKPGRLRGSGRVVRRGRDVAFLAGELRDSEDRVVATASASALVRRARERPATEPV